MERLTVEPVLQLRVGCEFRYEVLAPTPSVFLVRPTGSGRQRIRSEHWETDPEHLFHDYVDLYGNVCRRTTLATGWCVVRYEALVETAGAVDPADRTAPQLAVDELPDDVLVYTQPSCYCLSDELVERASHLFGAAAPGWECVQAICDYVHDTLRFAYGTAASGPSRDYAHLAISFCRAMNLPARYVFGYLPDIDGLPLEAPMDFASWIEVYLGDRWWTFDPSNNEPRKGRVLIARGRDASDVAMVTSYGAATLHAMMVSAEPAA